MAACHIIHGYSLILQIKNQHIFLELFKEV